MFWVFFWTFGDFHRSSIVCLMVSPSGSDGKESAYNAGDSSLIPRLGRSPGEGNDNPFQYSCLEYSMDRGAWQAPWGCRVKHDWATNSLLFVMIDLIISNIYLMSFPINQLSFKIFFSINWSGLIFYYCHFKYNRYVVNANL